MVPLLLSSSEFFAAVCGAWVAAYAHLFKTILEDYPPDTSFAEAVVDGLRRTFVYEGRSTRGQFWWFVLFTVLAPIPAYLVHRKLGATVSFLLYIPLLSAAARRLHDTGRNGWWVLLALFPGFGMLLLTFWLLGESRRSYPGEPEDEAPTRMGGIAKL